MLSEIMYFQRGLQKQLDYEMRYTNEKIYKKKIFSIPNIMGYFRIFLIPVFCYLYITAESEREYLYAAFVVLVSSLTDLLTEK